MFSIKICGITSVEDALLAAQAGADAIGLNFYSGSKRCVTPEVAHRIVAALPDHVSTVGVFVNEPAASIRNIADRLPIDHVQLHGDEPPKFLGELQGLSIIRALRLGTDGIAPLRDYLERTATLGCLPDAVLVDAHSPTEYGGTGQTSDWAALVEPRAWLRGLPLVLAGGLRPDNVAAAINQVRPVAVDTASGVESVAPRKDAALVRQFVSTARRALG